MNRTPNMVEMLRERLAASESPARYTGDPALDELLDQRIRNERRIDSVGRAIALRLEHGCRWHDEPLLALRRQLRAALDERDQLNEAAISVRDARAEREL